MGRYYSFDASRLPVAKLVMYDRGITISRWEEMLRDHELTPEGVRKAIELTTGDTDLAQTMEAHAELWELRRKGRV